MTDQALSLQQLNRTFIGSVLFIDIVGYSRGTVPEQIAMKDVFNSLLTEAVQNVAPGDRIMVDTGDGAGVAFLGDPEDALFAALSLRDAIDAGKVMMGEPGFVRMGINLGPLKMVRDINGHTNMIGDAVNDAQRVMSFANPGQVMVSHSYYDIISRFSVDYAKLFSFEGARRDKHVREHQVYSFGPNAGTEILTEKLRDRSRARNPNSIMPTPFDTPDMESETPPSPAAVAQPMPSESNTPNRAAANTKAASSAQVKSMPSRAAVSGKKQAPFNVGMVASIIVCVASVGAGAAAWYLHATKAATVTVRNGAPISVAINVPVTGDIKPAAASPASAAASTPAAIIAQKPGNPASAKTASAPSAPVAASSASPTNAAHVASATGAASVPNATGTTNAKANDASEAKPGTVSLSIEPWGEVFVDGVSSGVSPPLKSLKLTPGKHKIEIRNSDFAPFRKTIQVKSDVDVAMHYVF